MILHLAYVEFARLVELAVRDEVWLTRAKHELQSRVVRKLQQSVDGSVLQEELIWLNAASSSKVYPVELRRLAARVEVDKALRKLVFLMNHLAWSAKRG